MSSFRHLQLASVSNPSSASHCYNGERGGEEGGGGLLWVGTARAFIVGFSCATVSTSHSTTRVILRDVELVFSTCVLMCKRYAVEAHFFLSVPTQPKFLKHALHIDTYVEE